MQYSSKNYLENIWYPVKSNIWLAHYTEQTNYEGKYKVWQICNNGIGYIFLLLINDWTLKNGQKCETPETEVIL